MKVNQYFLPILLAIGLLAGFFILSGCAPTLLTTSQPEQTGSPTAIEPLTPTTKPSTTVHISATKTPTKSVTVQVSPTKQLSQSAQEISRAAIQLLAQEQNTDPTGIRLLSIQQVNWRDACLEIAKVGMMCAQVITPGYRIILEVNGQQFIYHTNDSGSQIVREEPPKPLTSGEIITWSREGGSACNKLVFTNSSLQFGTCKEPLLENVDIYKQLQNELVTYVNKYAPFNAETVAGKVDFIGRGKLQASPAEQRMIAEWLQLAFQIAQSGRTGAAWGLVLDWQREGGIAGFCDEVTIYLSGFASVYSCKGPAAIPVRILLSAEQLAQIYGWVDMLASFDYEQKDPAKADAMQIRMTFSGRGSEHASEQDIQAMQEMAMDILNQSVVPPDPMGTFEARTVLESYFAALQEGRYADAAALYGGDMGMLAGWNPDIDPNNWPALLERGCTQNGLVCNLSITDFLEETRISPMDYRFTVELSNPDGTPFVRGPCCGADPQTTPPETSLTFTVREIDGEYKVMDLPVYVP